MLGMQTTKKPTERITNAVNLPLYRCNTIDIHISKIDAKDKSAVACMCVNPRSTKR